MSPSSMEHAQRGKYLAAHCMCVGVWVCVCPQRALEEGEWNRATTEKLRLEEKQRQVCVCVCVCVCVVHSPQRGRVCQQRAA